MVSAAVGTGHVGIRWFGLAALAAAGIAAAVPAHATPVAVANGGFETLQTPANGSMEIGTGVGGGWNNRQNVTGWTSTGLTFVMTPGTADSPGATGQYGAFALWGPNSSPAPNSTPANTLPATSPAGGNYIVADGAPSYHGALQQTLSGLSPGSVANVSFYWAGAQQSGFTGPTTEAWAVSLGTLTQTTPSVSNVSHGFTGWQQTTFSFVVTNATEVLSFLAQGTPDGSPPMSLLDGVTLTQVPEPSTVALMLTALGLGGLAVRRRAAQRG